jgi:hypothetical protein
VPEKPLALALTIVALGALAAAAWLGEVVWIKGWQGLAWLEGHPWAAAVGIACAVVSAALPICAAHAVGPRRFALFCAMALPIAWVSFEVARGAVHQLLSPPGLPQPAELALQDALENSSWLAGAALLTAFGFTLAVRLALGPVSLWLAGLFLLALGLVLPMGLLTIQIGPALDGSTDVIHVVKMGYPLFWTSVLLGAASFVGVRF